MTTSRVAISLLLALGCIGLAAGATGAREQQAFPGQPRDGAPGPRAITGTAVISGIVTASGQPVSDARVMVAGMELAGGRTAVTDEHGGSERPRCRRAVTRSASASPATSTWRGASANRRDPDVSSSSATARRARSRSISRAQA